VLRADGITHTVADLPLQVFLIRDEGFDLSLSDRALVRACYRFHMNCHGMRDVAKWEAGALARTIQEIRLANMDFLEWSEARHD